MITNIIENMIDATVYFLQRCIDEERPYKPILMNKEDIIVIPTLSKPKPLSYFELGSITESCMRVDQRKFYGGLITPALLKEAIFLTNNIWKYANKYIYLQ